MFSRLTAGHIICKLPPQNAAQQIPAHISILEHPDQLSNRHKYPGSPNNMIPVSNVKDTGSRKYNFTVCVSPMFRSIRGNQMVEFIEVNRVFGADHFVFYNSSADTSSSELYFEYYAARSVLSLHPWTIPKRAQKRIHYFAQLAAINDCVYRNMFVSKYVVIVDLDEFIVPLKAQSWLDLIRSIDQGRSKCYRFQCVYFRTVWESDTAFRDNSILKQYNITTLVKTLRETVTLPHWFRSKTIVVPEAVKVAGIHYVQNFTHANEGVTAATNVTASEAIMFHYTPTGSTKAAGLRRKRETRMQDFAEDVMKRIERVHTSVKSREEERRK